MRAYSADTDKKIFRHEAELARLGNPDIPKRPPIIQDEDLEDSQKNILELDHVRDLMQRFKNLTQKRYGTADPRLGDALLSLGYWVLVLTGLLPEQTHKIYTQPRLFQRFRELYQSYSDGEETDMKLLTAEYKRACRYVMGVADVIGATPSICADERIYLGAHPNLIIIDEAGKVMEMFLQPIFAFFPHCRRFIIAGDTRQNRAHQGNLTAANCHFTNQSKVSLLERALIAGAARVYQNHQHRQLSALNRLPNEKWYGGALTTDSSVDNIPEAAQFREWMNGMFGIQENMIFLDVDGSVAQRIGKNPSLLNYDQLRLAVHVIIDLLKAHFSPSDITFMAPYTQQLSMMSRALQDVSRVPTLSALKLHEIQCISYDTMQGMEANIVVTTLTVTKRIGFLRDRRRMTTEATRPCFGHIYIGATHDMEKDKRYRGSAIKDVVDFCNVNHLRKFVDLDTMGCIHIPSVQIDDSTFVDRSRAEEGPSVGSDPSFEVFAMPTKLAGKDSEPVDANWATGSHVNDNMVGGIWNNDESGKGNDNGNTGTGTWDGGESGNGDRNEGGNGNTGTGTWDDGEGGDGTANSDMVSSQSYASDSCFFPP